MNPVALPGRPRNPEWILGDTDALIELVASDKLGVLKTLKSDYGIQTIVAEPVEVELRGLVERPKFKDVKHLLTRALSTGLLAVLGEPILRTLVGPQASVVLGKIETRGEAFRRLGVGIGEAYTHSVSVELNMPVLTNDRAALRILFNKGAVVPGPFLRSFDVIVFGHQIDILTESDCDQARKALTSIGETLERCFNGCSFTNGLPNFYQRLVDGSRSSLGSPSPLNRNDHKRLIVTAI